MAQLARQSEQMDPAVGDQVGPERWRCLQRWPEAIVAASMDWSLPCCNKNVCNESLVEQNAIKTTLIYRLYIMVEEEEEWQLTNNKIELKK